MAEEKFPPLDPSAEELNALREQMDTKIDCRALAHEMMEDRRLASSETLKRLSEEYGIEARQSLTDIESQDLGDAYDVADEPEVHALRYVPLGMWKPNDVYIMLAYGHGVETVTWLALDILEGEPLVEARHYPCDLLIEISRQTVKPDNPFGPEIRERLKAILIKAEEEVREDFHSHANQVGINDVERDETWLRLTKGQAAPPYDPFFSIANTLNELSVVRDFLKPPIIKLTAEAILTYAYYRQGCGLEIIPVDDLNKPDIVEHLEREDTFYFKRETSFQIVTNSESEGGVRLRHFSESAISNSLGIWCETTEDAKIHAQMVFGIAADAWKAHE